MFADAKAIETSIDPNHLTVESIYTFDEGKPFRAIYIKAMVNNTPPIHEDESNG